MISPEDRRIIRHQLDKQGYYLKDIIEFSRWLKEIGIPFLAKNSTLQVALNLALKWNKFDQAQQYYIPAMMLILGKRSEQAAYVEEVVSTFDRRAHGAGPIYLNFVQELEVAFEARE